MKKRFSKYLRIQEWWSHVLPPILLFYYLGLNDRNNQKTLVLALFFTIILLSILTAITGYFINDWFDINDDFKAGKSNFIASLSNKKRYLLFSILICMLILLYWVMFQLYSIQYLKIISFFLFLNLFLFLIYSIPPIRLKSKPFIALILDALYSGTLFYIMAYLLTSELRIKNVFIIILIYFFGVSKGIRNYLSHLSFDKENDIKVGQQTLATKYGKSRTQHIANLIFPIEIFFISVLFFFTLPMSFIYFLIFPFLFLFYWFLLFKKAKKVYIPNLNDLYEIWLPLFLLIYLIYQDHQLYGLLIIHTFLFPNYLDRIYFHTIFQLVGPLKKKNND